MVCLLTPRGAWEWEGGLNHSNHPCPKPAYPRTPHTPKPKPKPSAAHHPQPNDEDGPFSDLRGKLTALLVLAVSAWGLWEGRIIQGLLYSPRTDRCGANAHVACVGCVCGEGGGSVWLWIHPTASHQYIDPHNTTQHNTTQHNTTQHIRHSKHSTALAVAVGCSALVVLLWGYLDLYVGAVKGA